MKNEKGLTFIGMLLTMAAVIAAALLAMRIVPVYLQHYTITHALSSLNTIPNSDLSTDPAANTAAIKRTLLKQFEVNSIEDVTENNITIKPNGADGATVTIQYQVTRPLVSNISLLFNFNDSQEVKFGRE